MVSQGHRGTVTKDAADWFVKNRSESLNEGDCASFMQWLAQSAEHRRAYEDIEQVWETSAELDEDRLDSQGQRSKIAWFYGIGGIAASLLLVFVGLLLVNAADVYQTDIGEQRLVTLADGSTIHLNTNTRLQVEMGDRVRFISLLRGEAVFAVAHNERKPFVVQAGNHQVTALGTEFNVYQKYDRYELTVLEGSVRVTPTLDEHDAAGSSDKRSLYNPVLAQGERVDFSRNRISKPEAADIGRIQAWKSGKLEFDAEPLVNVLLEVNRYSTQQVALGRPDLGDHLISGTFHANDTQGIVLALAETLQLSFSETPNGYLLMPR